MANCDFLVSGFVPSIKQPDTMDCWIACATMLLSWKNGTTYGVSAVAALAGEPFATYHKKNTGLPTTEIGDFVKALALTAEAPQNYSIQGWRDLLKAKGPLFVVTAEKSFPNHFAVHARIVIEISGDCSAANTTLTVIDPVDASDSKLSYADFLKTYETLAGNSIFTFQVVHCG